MDFKSIIPDLSDLVLVSVHDDCETYAFDDTIDISYDRLYNEYIFTLKRDRYIKHIDDRRYHREDGPAIISPESNNVLWFLMGKKVTFKEWVKASNLSEKEKVKIKLKFGDLI